MRAPVLECAALVALAAAGCLPKDTRPPPAEVTVTASASTLTLNGGIPSSLTADGFDIVVNHFIVNLGQAELGQGDAPACDVYSNPDYTRTVDFTAPGSPHELGLAFATGECPFGFVVRPPNDSSVVEPGVDSSIDDFIRTAGSDPDSMNAGVSVYLEGVARRGDQSWSFAWAFRKRIAYSDCGAAESTGNSPNGLELSSGENTTVNLEVRAEALFQGEPGMPFHFAPYALADTDGDGEIGFDELWNVPIADFSGDGLYLEPPGGLGNFTAHPCFTQDGDPVEIETLGDYAYCLLLPNVVAYEGSRSCSIVTGRKPSGD